MAKKQAAKAKNGPGVRTFKIDQLREMAGNPRIISDLAFSALTRSIERFGCVEPVIVNVRDGRNTIVGGHQRIAVLKRAGVKDVICVTVDLDDEGEKILNITLNNPHAQGEFIAGIGEYIEQLREGMADPQGLLDLEIEALKGELAADERVGLIDDDEVPESPKKELTQVGDVWEIGRHRLICGDCREAEVMKKLFGKGKARRPVDMVFTDPPYNMAYKSKTLGGIKNDHMAQAEFVRFILDSAFAIKNVLREGGSYYICMSAAEYPTVYHQLRKLKMGGRQLIWAKESIGMGSQDYRPQFEVMLYGYTGGRDKRTWNGARTESDLWGFDGQRGIVAREDDDGMIIEIGQGIETWQIVLPKKMGGKIYHFDGRSDDLWQIARVKEAYTHPTQKPVALVERALVNSSGKDDLVFDPFLGSGTTLIACEKLDRSCCGVELDPKYCDVAVRRWEQWIGQKARKATGKK